MSDLTRFTSDPRVTVRRGGEPDPEGRVVLYWMQRAQRAADNPALDVAIRVANLRRLPVVAYFGLITPYPSANLRHYTFLVEGLADIAAGLAKRGVGLVVRRGAAHAIGAISHELRPALVVSDENPLREPERWRELAAKELRVPFWTVDADVVVPGRLLEKEQYAARTIRPRIRRQLEWCLKLPLREPVTVVGPPSGIASLPTDSSLLEGLGVDDRVGPVTGFRGGAVEARRRLRAFVRTHLRGYAAQRNRPEIDGTSRLSPYLHFGHIGPREVALAVRESDAPLADRQAFLEQLIVRRELAVNFVRFNPNYDRLEGCEPWARETLNRHRRDRRERVYTLRQLEQAETHDPLWNAAQRQMVVEGWMHGYVRMYWAKKILEWTRSPEEAFEAAILLNDRYELDGRDPNGYAGIAWALGGKHDRAWGPERPVFGTIRYMSWASTSRKFDSRRYIARVNALGQVG